MLKCRDIQRLASEYEDGELNWLQKLKLRYHLLICRHCRLFLKQFLSIRRISEQSTMKPASDKEVQAVMDKIRSHHQGRSHLIEQPIFNDAPDVR